MASTQTQSTATNKSTKEPQKGHDFRQLNQISKDLLCVDDKNGMADLQVLRMLDIRFYGMTYDGAQKACPWQTKVSDDLPPFLCRTTEPGTHCPYIPRDNDRDIAFKSGRCLVSEDLKQHPDGRLHYNDLWNEGGRQHAVFSHLRGHQRTYPTPFISAHDSLNRSIGRGAKCRATDLTIISTRKLVELGYPVIKSKDAMVNYSLGSDKDWLYSTEWLMLWQVPRTAVIMNYSWSEVQTKGDTLAGRAFRNRIARKVRAFDLQNGFSPSFGPEEEPPNSDEEAHIVEKKAAAARKTRIQPRKNTRIGNGAQSSTRASHDTSALQQFEDEDEVYGEPEKQSGEKRKRIPQEKLTGFEPHERIRFMDMSSFDEAAKTNGYAKTMMQATVPVRGVYVMAKLPGYPSDTFLKRRDHGSHKERRGLSKDELVTLRIIARSSKNKQGDDEDEEEEDEGEAQAESVVARYERTYKTASTQTSPHDYSKNSAVLFHHEGLALLARRMNIDPSWLRNRTRHDSDIQEFVLDLIEECDKASGLLG